MRRAKKPGAVAALKPEPATGPASSYKISDSGSFVKDDIKINADGITHQGDTPAALRPDLEFSSTSNIKLSDLEIGKFLGRGAAGCVNEATHKVDRRKFALKKVDILDDTTRSQLIPEIKSLLSTRSPLLVSLHDAFFEQHHVYLALEYMDAGAVQDLVKAIGPTPEPVLAAIMYQTLRATQYLHHRKQVHRDMKPENLLANTEGEVKIADFGIARELDATQAAAATFVGTALYMSPERLEGKEYSFSADIWAIGVIALSCATGDNPYGQPKGYFELLSKIMQGPKLDDERFTPEFRDFVSHCLHKEPLLRKTAEQLLSHGFITSHVVDEAHAKATVKSWVALKGDTPAAEGEG